MPHQKSSDYKETAVQYYLVEDKSQEEVCKIFKCSRRSLMRWVDKYKKYGKITGYERTPKAYKVHKEHVDFLLQEIKHNKTITIEDLLLLLKNKYPDVELNKSHISRIIHDNNITLKMTRIRHEPIQPATPTYYTITILVQEPCRVWPVLDRCRLQSRPS